MSIIDDDDEVPIIVANRTTLFEFWKLEFLLIQRNADDFRASYRLNYSLFFALNYSHFQCCSAAQSSRNLINESEHNFLALSLLSVINLQLKDFLKQRDEGVSANEILLCAEK